MTQRWLNITKFTSYFFFAEHPRSLRSWNDGEGDSPEIFKNAGVVKLWSAYQFT